MESPSPIFSVPPSSLPLLSFGVLLGATCIDLLYGEPPAWAHPVVWMGKVTSGGMRHAPTAGKARQLLFGACLALAVPAGFATASWLLLVSTFERPLAHVLIATVIFSTTFSVRALGQAARRMTQALEGAGPVEEARKHLAALCSRDPSRLTKEQLAAATIESVAENSSDSFVAPLFYFALFGVPGAVFYRAVNTLDAMVGYHGKYEYLGKTAARLDDVLNWIPARLTVVLLLLSGKLRGYAARRGLSVALRDHKNTESPNAGWPMAAMAGLLNIELAKVDHYCLGNAHDRVTARHIDASWKIARTTFFLALAFSAIFLGVRRLAEVSL